MDNTRNCAASPVDPTSTAPLPPDHSDAQRLCISIVSHGQGRLVGRLLADLATLAGPTVDVVVTLNIPESEQFLQRAGYPIRVIRNPRPKGYGGNHNQAFATSDAPFFAVLNPDIRCTTDVFASLIDVLKREGAGVCGPGVHSPAGHLEDSARRFPSPGRITARALRRIQRHALTADYAMPQPSGSPVAVDWIGGMFMLFDAQAFRQVQGFDDAFFMYLEDADICRRLGQRGCRVLWVPDLAVVHDAQRSSHRHARYLWWHVSSMTRFFAKRLLS